MTHHEDSLWRNILDTIPSFLHASCPHPPSSLSHSPCLALAGYIDREDVAGLYLLSLALGVLDQDPLAGLAHRQGLQCPGQLSEEETIKH